MPSGSALSGLQFSIEDIKAPLVVSAQVDSEEKAAVLRNNLAASAPFSKAEIISIVAIEDKEVPAVSTDPAVPSTSTPQSPYKYTATINTYFKSTTGSKVQ